MTGTKVNGVPDGDLIYQPVWREDKSKLDYTKVERNSTHIKAENIFKHIDVVGKNVFDVGCNNGFFCFEAAHLGAKRVLGIDYHYPAIKLATEINEIYKFNIEFIKVNIQELFYFRGKLSYIQPDIVFMLSILHHQPIDIQNDLIRYAGLGAKTIVFEFVHNDVDQYLHQLRDNLDTRFEFEVIESGFYNNKEKNDLEGVKRAIIIANDPHVDKKWIRSHDDGNITRFEVKNGVLKKFHYEGRDDRLIEQRDYYEGELLYRVDKKPKGIRVSLIRTLNFLAKCGIIHGELYKNIILENGKNLRVIDFDTQYNIPYQNYGDYYNSVQRINKVHGKIDENDKEEFYLWGADIRHIDRLLSQFKSKPLTKDEKIKYYELLHECVSTVHDKNKFGKEGKEFDIQLIEAILNELKGE